ncbi:hypothetical protein FSARC_13191 [Fusarium sarcochroum]|uniref:Uncharacterized protein n=1 Tax=Fusarium sarcochroum TaxID=1208366 RepID=A0A8H4T369_9HYPO|nr:hypothetical protein FSARC_13191 [Fusarium sarcochroum]
MDFFQLLPPELRFEVFLSLRTRSSIMLLLRASPTMLAQYRKNKILIQQAYYKEEFDTGMFQDALAIIHFPPQDTPEPNTERILGHIVQWSKRALPNPFEGQDHTTLKSLDNLYDRFLIFIEDYITKATSAHPWWTCIGEPDLSSKRGRILFRGKPKDIDILKIDSLNKCERKRLFQAFLRYEVLSKVCYLRREWPDKNVVDRIIKKVYGKLRNWQGEAIRCVYDYLHDLEGALAAHYTDPWLSGLSPESVLNEKDDDGDSNFEFPDTVWFRHMIYVEEFAEDNNFEHWHTGLTLCGFDPITSLLTSPRDNNACSEQLLHCLKAERRRLEETLNR